jgi:hypothetical protein
MHACMQGVNSVVMTTVTHDDLEKYEVSGV